MHEKARARACELGEAWVQRMDARLDSDKAALRELLKGQSVYMSGDAHTNLQSFKPGLVSRPADNWDFSHAVGRAAIG